LSNYSSGISTFSVLNATDAAYAANVFLLLGTFGAEDAEIVQILSVNNSTGVINTITSTLFSHSESTRVTVLPYNQIRFFHTTTTTFSQSSPLTGYLPLQVSDWFTTYNDEVNSTGYGWYVFYNSGSLVISQESNAIPYGGFESNTTENILSDFFSMLSNKELKLVTREDALSWASEGYGRMKNKLNLTNKDYSVSAITALNIIAGQIEYDLPVDFDHLISFISGVSVADPGARGGIKFNIDFIPLREAYWYNGTGPRYYIRRNKIGILPTPTEASTYHYNYQSKGTRLSLNTDEVDLPNGGEYVIKDWMLYRAFQKFQNPQYKQYLESFTNGLNDMIIASVKRDANLDWFGIQRQSNV
jgi:hypothetical protein